MDMRECKAKLIMLGWKKITFNTYSKDKIFAIFLVSNNKISIRRYGNELYRTNYDEIIDLELI